MQFKSDIIHYINERGFSVCMNNSMSEKLISVFSSEYLEKLFYFCLKKTSDRQEAEDLSSDIALNIITELKKGVVPDMFSAWVWRIARNRYSFWANKKRIKNNAVSSEYSDGDISDIEDNENFEYELVHGEDLKLLRRELSFISKDYRDIVVAYYIDDLKAKTIAQMLNLPENTVTSKLYRSRKILREGMNMAREFGTRSYKPENISFMASGSQPSGLPWRVVQRKLPKNILLQANNNPSTMDELAVEIGIAMPYMEEEVEILTDAELLKEVNGKYVTNFFIADKECQLEIYNAQRKKEKEISGLLNEIVTKNLPEIRKLINAGETISDNELKWLIMTRMIDASNQWISHKDEYKFSGYQRKDGGNWGFMGLEENNLISEKTETWQNGNTGGGKDGKVEFWRYSYVAQNIGLNRSCLGYNQSFLFEDIVINKRNINSFTEDEKRIWKDIDGWYAHADKNGNVIFDVPVFNGNNFVKMLEIIMTNSKEDMNKIYGYTDELFAEIKAILIKYSNPVIADQINYYIGSFMWTVRGMVINDAVEAKNLIVPEVAPGETVKCNIGLYVDMNLTSEM